MNLYAISALSGSVRWTYNTAQQIYSSPSIDLANGIVYVHSEKMTALSLIGSVKWIYNTENTADYVFLYLHSSPTIGRRHSLSMFCPLSATMPYRP
jgi:outer membrane protein assembly factor BamB